MGSTSETLVGSRCCQQRIGPGRREHARTKKPWKCRLLRAPRPQPRHAIVTEAACHSAAPACERDLSCVTAGCPMLATLTRRPATQGFGARVTFLFFAIDTAMKIRARYLGRPIPVKGPLQQDVSLRLELRVGVDPFPFLRASQAKGKVGGCAMASSKPPPALAAQPPRGPRPVRLASAGPAPPPRPSRDAQGSRN